MNSMLLAWIAPLPDSGPEKALNCTGDLMIGGARIAFMREPLLEDARFQVLESPSEHIKLWLLEFFTRSSFKTRFVVAVRELNATYMQTVKEGGQELDLGQIEQNTFDQIGNRYGKQLIFKKDEHPSHHILVCIENMEQEFEDARRVCSKWLRGANTLGKDQFECRSGRYLAVDGAGVGLIAAQELDIPLFQRMLVLFALSQGYMVAIERAIKGLADKCEHPKELEALYRDALTFNARSFFRYPVKLKRNELTRVWEQIEQRFLISEHNQELINQLDAVRRLLEERANRKAAKRDRWANFALTFLGVLIGFLSLGALIDITPEKVDSFIDGWSAWVQQHHLAGYFESLWMGKK